jgi:hypothetical protein
MKMLLGCAFALGFAMVAAARRHDELNSIWVLRPTPVKFDGQPVTQSGTVTIDDREGNITVTRNFTYAGAQTFYYHDSTDGPRGAKIRGQGAVAKVRWEGDTLNVSTTRGGVETTDRYRLAPDGTMIDVVESAGRTPVTLVFHRQ